MFEARIVQGQILKKIIEAIRELVTDANLDCNEEQGISMQVGIFLKPIKPTNYSLRLFLTQFFLFSHFMFFSFRAFSL